MIIVKKMHKPNILVVYGIWAHIPLHVNQSKFRIHIDHIQYSPKDASLVWTLPPTPLLDFPV